MKCKGAWILLSIIVLFMLSIYRCFRPREQPKVSAALKETQTESATAENNHASPLLAKSHGAAEAEYQPLAGVESGRTPSALSQQTIILEHQVVESLSGNVDPNGWMDTIAEFVQFPLSPVPVENWRDDSVEIYEFLIGDEHAKAYFEIDKEDQGNFAIRVEAANSQLIRGLYRRASEVSIHFKRMEGDGIQSAAIQSYCKVAIGRNRKAGIEASKGTFSEGVIYHYDASSGGHSCFQTGIQDGKPIKIEGECKGDLNIDLERVRLLNDRVTMLLGELGK